MAGPPEIEPGLPPPSTRESALSRAATLAWQLLIIGVAVLLVGYIFRRLSGLVVPVILALLLAAIVNPAVRWLGGHNVPRWLAVLLPMLALSIVLIAAGTLVVYSLSTKGPGLEQSIRTGVDQIEQQVQSLRARLGVRSADGHGWLNWVTQNGPGMLVAGVVGVVTAVAEFLLAVVLCFFLLLDLERLKAGLSKRMKRRSYLQLETTIARSWSQLEQYLRGITITALANSLMFGLALVLIGVPLVVANMVILFIGSFIPYVGPVTATTVAGLLALGEGGLTDLILVVIAGIAIQLIEGNVLHPFVVGHAVSMSPFFIVATVAAGGIIAGLLGALIAVPVATVGMILLDTWREQRGAGEVDIVSP